MSKKKIRKGIVTLAVLGALAAGIYLAYRKLFSKIDLKDKNYTYIYIENDHGLEEVISEINAESIIENVESFEW
ncbi:MAG: hypothetical protein JNL60_02400, partial [Bacteroidia bacterium]|nr:hypothetical protein [Bacteroidia bacterium]